VTEALTISSLEKQSGVSRTTIHYYLREGLLPAPQKTAASRALYTEDHLRLLQRIAELKQRGLSLAEVKEKLGPDLAKANENRVDLAGQENQRIHRAILRLATQEFATKGYRGTHVAAIVRTLGITSQVFYSHFPSKLQLYVESFETFLSWNLAFVEPKVMQADDVGERLLWRLLADDRANEFGAGVMTRVNSEPSLSDAEKHRLSDKAWEKVVARVVEDLESVRQSEVPPPVSLELLVYSLLGAHHSAVLRASWDERFTRADPIRLHLWLWLAVTAAISGEVDIDSRIARYEDIIREVAARKPETPPALGE
jgi:DNA-binding transcriptional MerR regulator